MLIRGKKNLLIFLCCFITSFKPNEDFDVCQSSVLTRASICCHTAIAQLKVITKQHYDFYMNYIAFVISEPCMMIEVQTIKQYTNTYMFINQPVLNCFGRTTIMSFDKLDETKLYYQKIKIHPWNLNEMMVFIYTKENNYEYYTLLTIMKHYLWIESTNVLDKVFLTPVPQSWSDKGNLYHILYPMWSTMNTKRYAYNNPLYMYLNFNRF